MKYTVSLFLLVATVHGTEPRRKPEDDSSSAKRELLEGNYGLRIRPSTQEDALQNVEPQPDYSRKNDQQTNVPTQEFGPPRSPHQEYGPPVAKISDVLTGQGPSVSAAIASHLYSPVSVYQPKLGSATTFEVSHPVPSQLRYSEHRIFNDNFQQTFEKNEKFESLRQPQALSITQQQNYEKEEILGKTNQNFGPKLFNGQPIIITQGDNYERQENLIQNFEPQKTLENLPQNAEAIRQSNANEAQRAQQEDLERQNNQQNLQNIESNNQSQLQPQQPILQQNVAFTDLRPPRPDDTPFLPRLEPFQPQTQPIYSEQTIQRIFPQIQGFPPDFFQQINQLGNQLTYSEETIHYVPNPAEQQANEAKKQLEQQNISQSQQQTSTETQASTPRPQLSTVAPNQNTQSQTVNYASFSQSPPPPSNILQGPSQQNLLQLLPSPSPLPQFQQLPQLQQPQLFQPLPQLPLQPIQQIISQPQLQPLPHQLLFQPLPPQPTVQPFTSVTPQTLFPVQNQTPQRIGIIRIRQGSTQLTQSPQYQPTLTNTRPQSQQTFSTFPQSHQTFSTFPQNQQTFTTRSQNERESFTTQQPQVATSLNSQPTFTSEGFNGLSNDVSTISTTLAPRSTSESFRQSTESSTTPDSVSIVPKFVSTLPTRSFSPTRSTSPAQPTSPPQILFSSTLAPSTLPPQPVTETPLPTISTSIQSLQTLAPVSQPQLILTPIQTSEPQPIQLSTQPQIQPTLHPVQSTSLQPLPTQPPLPVTQSQPLPTQQPYPVTPQPLPQLEIPGVRAVPVQRIQSEYQPLIEVQEIEQQQPLQLLQVTPGYPVQIQLQPTLSPPPQLHQIQSQSDQQLKSLSQLKQRQQSQFESSQQQQSQAQAQQIQSQQQQTQSQEQIQSQQQQSQSQSEQNQQSHFRQHAQTEPEKEAAIAHAHELLYNFYSPFLQQTVPVYSEAQNILIQQPYFKATSLAFPSSYSPSHPFFQASPSFSSTQYFGKYAQDIFGGHHPHHHTHHYSHHYPYHHSNYYHHSYIKK